MIVYDQTSIAFIRRCEDLLREILTEIGIEVKRNRFVIRSYLYPLKVVVFEGSDLGHFNAPFYQIGMNKKLIYQAKDSVVRDILKHELAHYLTWIDHGQVQAHGPEFRETCQRFGFPDEVALSKINLEAANLSKEGDLESERIIERIKKLLQLAQSSNVHEAEVATMKANALLLRHNLDHIQTQEDEPLYMDRVLVQKKKDSKMSAIYEILRHFLVRPVISFGRGMCCLEISGTQTNVKLAIYIADFLDKEMDHLWQQARNEYGFQGLRAKNSFFLGIAKGFNMKMEASKYDLPAADQKSLMVVEKSLDAKIRQVYGRLTSSRSGHNPDERAGAVGVMKGRNLTIRQGVESSSKGLYLGFSKS